jgi:hypothetical protein
MATTEKWDYKEMPTLGKVFYKQAKLVSKHPAKGYISVPRKFIGKEFDVIMIPRFDVSKDVEFTGVTKEKIILETIKETMMEDNNDTKEEINQTESGM